MGQSVVDFEQKMCDQLESEGFDVLRSGYPDFMVKRSGRYSGICAIEVKQGSDTVRPNQVAMHQMFKEAGIPVYVIRPEDVYGEDNKKIRPKVKFRFKQIINATHYQDMAHRINVLSNRFNGQKSYLNNLIETATKEMDDTCKKIESLVKSMEVESVILNTTEERDITSEG